MNGGALPGLYLHIPFCHSKCHYCDFYSRPCRDSGEFDLYANALSAEYRLRCADYTADGVWGTVYIGGGTPSIMPVESIRRIIKGTALECLTEFTVEANPDDITEKRLTGFMETGINRISMGVQSFDDRELSEIGRRHTADKAHEAASIITGKGISLSMDLIYGLPGQTVKGWEYNLRTLLSYRPEHFSAYLLSYEPGTRLYQRMTAGKCKETAEETIQEMYRLLCDIASAKGYEHYEISNFALPGKRALHNSNYWKGIPYLGLGPSAHSFDGLSRGYNPSDIKTYLSSLSRNILPFIVEHEKDPERLNDIIITSLRTSDGLNPGILEQFDGSLSDSVMDSVAKLCREGLLQTAANGNVFIPEKEWLRSDSIFRELIVV